MKLNSIVRFFTLSALSVLLFACGASKKSLTQMPELHPKREFRGVWVQTVGQSRYQQMNSAAMKHYIVQMMKKFEAANGPIQDIEAVELPLNFGGPTAQA